MWARAPLVGSAVTEEGSAMHISLLSGLLAAQLALPVSDTVPTLKVDASCKATASIDLANAQDYDACMKDENAARDELRSSWVSFSAVDRGRCVTEASIGTPSYVDLLVCLQTSRDAAELGKTKLKGARTK
jgi:hypothetical protein